MRFIKGEVQVWQKDGKITNAWLLNGLQVVPVFKEEEILDPEMFATKILSEKESGKYRCSDCKGIFDGEPAGRPLFAGINCPACWERHSKKIEQERKSGNVCRRCGEPRSLCCC